MALCDLCKREEAAIYCINDQASLCTGCDASMHSANPFAFRHERVPLHPTSPTASTGPSSTAFAAATAPQAALAASPFAPAAAPFLADEEDDAEPLDWFVSQAAAEAEAAAFPWGAPAPAAAPAAPKAAAKPLLEEDDNPFLRECLGDLLGEADSGALLYSPAMQDGVVPTMGYLNSALSLGLTPAPLGAAPSMPARPAPFARVSAPRGIAAPPALARPPAVPASSVASSAASVSGKEIPLEARQRLGQRPAAAAAYASWQPLGAEAEGAPLEEAAGESSGDEMDDAGPLYEPHAPRQRGLKGKDKRRRRPVEKVIRYPSRKAYADIRPRIKGRFATKAEVDALKAQGAL